MRRTVSARLDLEVTEPALLVAVADGAYQRSERLTVTSGDRPLTVTELPGPHGTRLHQVRAPVGRVSVDYRASVHGRDAPPPTDRYELISYLRASRYAESDRMIGLANVEFAGLAGTGLLAAVGQWVESHVASVTGSSVPTDGAVQTLLGGRGVCRDFAHLTVSLLRACCGPVTCRRGSPRSMPPASPRWTSTPWPRRTSTTAGTSSTRRTSTKRSAPWSSTATCRSRSGPGSSPRLSRQLIAVAVAHVTQCPYCIAGHTKIATRRGATDEQIMEAIWVAAEMRAGGAYAHSTIALNVMDAHSHSNGERVTPALPLR